jgi:hypothetical protein
MMQLRATYWQTYDEQPYGQDGQNYLYDAHQQPGTTKKPLDNAGDKVPGYSSHRYMLTFGIIEKDLRPTQLLVSIY